MMEQKEGLTSVLPDSQLTLGLAKSHQNFDPPHSIEDIISSSVTKSPVVCSNSEDRAKTNADKYVVNPNLQQNPFQTPDLPSLIKSVVCEDVRLLEAAKSGMTDVILHLIEEEGQQLHNHRDKEGKSALHLASAAGHSESVAALTLNGADVSSQDFTGHTALQRAAAEGHLDVVKHLIGRGAPVDHQDDVHGNTALHESAWKGFSRTVDLLCRNKSNYYLRNRGGFSPLHLCCQNGHNESCRILLRAGCKPNIKNNYGDTPIHTAARYGHAGVARILVSARCNTNLQNKNGDTPLHIASAMGRKKLVRILVEYGFTADRDANGGQITVTNIEALNLQHERAIDIAQRKEHKEIVEMLKNPDAVVANHNTTSSGIGVENNEHGIEIAFSEKSKIKHKGGTEKTPEKKKKKKYQKFQGSDKGDKNQLLKHRVVRNRGLSYKLRNGSKDSSWSPYGCHYYPDPSEFPDPNVSTLPNEPLSAGEQYYLDLAGNIKKGPSSNGTTCYCEPFIHRCEQQMDQNKKEVLTHLKNNHGRLANRINSLEKKTKDQISYLSNSMKETIAQERVECQDRMERRAIRDRVALDRHQVMRNLMLKGDLSEWLEKRINVLEVTHDQKSTENHALMRNLLRGSKRRKRAIISELQSGSLRRALSEDELGPGDEESGESDNKSEHGSENKKVCNQEFSKFDGKPHSNDASAHPILLDLHLSSDQRRRRHAGNENIRDLASNLESLTVQSEFGFPSVMKNHSKRYLPNPTNRIMEEKHRHNFSYYDGFDGRLPQNIKLLNPKHQVQDLEVSDHPHLYQNTLQALKPPENHLNSLFINSSRRNSISESEILSKTTALFCDFGDFNTQELYPNDDKATLIHNKMGASFSNTEPLSRVQNAPKVYTTSSSGSMSSKTENLTPHYLEAELPLTSPSSVFIQNTSQDILSHSTNSDSNAQTNSANTSISNVNSQLKLLPSHRDYNTAHHRASPVTSIASPINSQSYIKPLEIREPPLYFNNLNEKQHQYQQYVQRNLSAPPPLMLRPIPFTPVQAAPPPLPQRIDQQLASLNISQPTNNVPFLPPKKHQPPPYRPPPINKTLISGMSQPGPLEPSTSSLLSNNQMLSPTNRLLMMPPIEEDVSYMSQEPLLAMSNNLKSRDDGLTSPPTRVDASGIIQPSHHGSNSETFQHANINGALSVSNSLSNPNFPAVQGTLLGVGCGCSSDGGGSHDSHNDSGYCIGSSSTGTRFGSGGPSPSLSGSQGRPDSRGPASDALVSPGAAVSENVSMTMSSLRSTNSYMRNGILCGGGNSSSGNNSNSMNGTGVVSMIGPRIRQLQQQLNSARNSKPSKQTMPPPLMAVQNFGPKGSLV